MSSAGLLLLTIFTAPMLLAQSAAPPTLDGLAILQKMSAHYAKAGSWYIAATEEQTKTSAYSRQWTKMVMMGAVSGSRYHFEGHSNMGSALHISDGRIAWDLHPEERAYTQEPAPARGYQPPYRVYMNESAARRAFGLLKEFSSLASYYSGATRLPDENLMLNGKSVPCYVVQVTSDQRKGPHPPSYSSREKLWIEKATWTVRKTVMHDHSSLMVTGSVRIPIEDTTVTLYSTAALDGEVPDSLFHFKPPQSAHEVAKFNDGSFGPDLTGELAPDVQVVGQRGKSTPLSSFRGKPVLLDFWATWCAPCIEGLPKLAELAREARPKGLIMLSIDEDDSVKKADDYLAQHHYSWPNMQDDGKIGDAFSKTGIPLYVLINAQGRIVFYKMAPTEQDLRQAVEGLGPRFAALAKPEKPQTFQTTVRQ